MKLAKPIKVFDGHHGFSLDVKFGLLLSGGRDWTIRLWDIDSGEQLWSTEHTGAVYAVSITQDRQNAVAVANTTVMTLDLKSGIPISVAPVTTDIHNIGLSSSGKLIAFTRSDGVFGAFDTYDGSLILRCRKGSLDRSVLGRMIYLLGGQNATFNHAFSIDDGTLSANRYVAGVGHVIDVYDLSTGKVQARIRPPRRPTNIAISHDGRRIAYSLDDGTVYLHNAKSSEYIATLCESRAVYQTEGGGPAKIIFCSSSVVTVLPRQVEIWNLNGEKLNELHFEWTSFDYTASVTADRRYLVISQGLPEESIKLYALQL